MNIPRLPDAELEVMKLVWKYGENTTSAMINEGLKGYKEWNPTTVLTFLSRLADKGFVSIEKKGKANYYTPLIEEARYVESESKSFLKRLHDNSIKSLFVALYSGKEISKKDLEELKQFVEER